jgi:hypothetical protein
MSQLQTQNPDGSFSSVEAGYNDVNGSDLQSDQVKSQSDFANGPLASLFKSKYNYDAIQYPSDLNSSGKGHAIVFDIYQPQSASVEVAKNKVLNTVKDVVKSQVDSLEAAGGVTAVVGSALATGAGAVASGVGSAAVGAYNIASGQTDYLNQVKGAIIAAGEKTVSYLEQNFDDLGTGQTAAQFLEMKKDLRATVSLYMPETLSFTYTTSYGEESIIGAAASLPGLLGKPASFVNSVMENQAVKLALNKLGYAFNPQEQVLFQGIHFRTFEMSFTFSPRSAHESSKVQQIVKLFRSYAAPTIVTGVAGFFYTPPGVFNLSFKKDGAENPNINKLTDCVLESVTVNYAPNGWSSHKDGQPTQMTMDLSFKETVLVDRAKIEQGY